MSAKLNICSFFFLLVVLRSETSYGINFEPQVYRLQIPFQEVQINRTLFYAEFNSPLARESVISVEIISNSKIPASNFFLFRIDDFGVQNIRPLHAGPHRFLIVVFLVNTSILQATVSIEIISPRGRRCIEQAFGKCSHNCRESDIQPIQYECYCDNGYVLHGNFDCFAAKGTPQLFIMNGSEIGRLNLVESSYSLVLGLRNLIAFDYNYRNKVLYAVTSDGSNSSLIVYSLDTQNITTKVFENVDIISIVVNWIGDEIYFVDRLSFSIMSISIPNYNARVLFQSPGLPSHLIYSNMGYLVWVIGSSENTSVEQFNLADNSSTFHNLTNVIDIAMSGQNEKVFAITNNGLFTITLSQDSSPQNIAPFINGSIALDVFEVYSYILLLNGSVVQINNKNSDQMATINTIQVIPGAYPLDVAVYHELKQVIPSVTNCSLCDGECLIKNSISTCICPEGFILGLNGYSCQQSEASSYLVSFNFKGGAILEHYVLGPQVGYNLFGFSKQGQSAGNIFGMAVNLADRLIYYGDRLHQSIMQVSLDPLLTNVDDRTLLLEDMNVLDMTYDWINKHLYWIDDKSHRIYRGNVQNLSSSELFYQADHQVLGIAVDPFSGFLYWSDNSTGIVRRSINSLSSPAAVWHSCCIQAMAINHLSNSLYWFEVNSTGSQLMEMSLISNNNVSLLFISSDDFFPFRLAVLQSYFLVTSVNVSKLVLINRVDYSVIMSSTITPYFALALIAPIQQPTEGQYTCFTSKSNCTYTCVTGSSDPANCTCPVGYFLNKDNFTCSDCPLNTFGPNCMACNCINGTCSRFDGTCVCNEGYTGVTCNEPVCDRVNCGVKGRCSAPNFCQCDETYEGTNCTLRTCTDSFCSFAGTCSVLDGGAVLSCDCDVGRIGLQCQDIEIILPPQGLQDIQIGASMGVLLLVIGVVVVVFIVVGYLVLKQRRKLKKVKKVDQ